MRLQKILKKGVLLLSLLFICSNTLLAQDLTYWFVAPHLDNSGGTNLTGNYERPVFFMITTGSEAAKVKMSQPANSSFTPINIDIPANSSYKLDFTTDAQMRQISNEIRNTLKVGVKDDKGILFEADAPVTIFYQVDSYYSKDIFALKGAKALGTEFYTPFQKEYLSNSSGYPYAYAQFHIVATEDNTTVHITPKSNIVGTNAGVTKTVVLNKGETFAARTAAILQAARLDGSHIVSDKPIAVTVCDDLISTGNGADVTGDQIVPVDKIGTNYVVIRGYTLDTRGDFVYVLGTQNNTKVYLGGSATPTTTINAGETYSFKMLNSELTKLVTADKPVYVYQLSGVGGEMGAVLLPSMYSINSKRVTFYRTAMGQHNLFILVRSGNEDGFTVRYKGSVVSNVITSADFTAVPGLSDWKYARKSLAAILTGEGQCVIENTKGVFSLGYFSTNDNSGSASYGYLSNFGQLEFPDTTFRCFNQPLTLDAGYALQYKWWKGEKDDEPTTGLSTSNTYSVPINETGYYTAWANQDPFKVWATTYVAIDTFKLNATIPEYAKVNTSQNLSVSVKRPIGKSYLWTMATSTPNTAAAATATAQWSTTGEHSVSIKVNNDDLHCDTTYIQKVYVYDIQDDYAYTTQNMPLTINVLANDDFPSFTPSVAIATPPVNGSAVMSGNNIAYTPNSSFTGVDKIQYKVTYNTHTAYAWVYISVSERPDNITDAECFVTPPARDWEINLLKQSKVNYFAYGSPVLAGDLDGDGKVEIVLNDGSPDVGTKLVILDDNLDVKYTLSCSENFVNTTSTFAMANVDGGKYAAIFIATTGRQLKKFTLNTTTKKYEEEWSVQYSANVNYDMGNPLITDFNGDGYADISIYDKVFDAREGTLLVDGNLLGTLTPTTNTYSFGMRGGHPISAAKAKHASLMAAGDIDGDGLPELVAGNCVYKVSIKSRTDASENSFTLLRRADNTGHAEVGDGPTSLADMDLDGQLDVVVTRNISTSYHGVYIWNPRTGEVMHSDVINNLYVSNHNDFGPSLAAIGNMDDDPQPELAFIGFDYMYVYDYDPATKRLTQKWNMYVNDESAITLFDFNQNNKLELVYRDFTRLMIINGENKNVLTSIACGSGTANEYPLILDVNNDGHAEFVIVAGGNNAIQGTVRIYGSETWAPARKVWNQYAYNSSNVNDDLTIPRYQLNPATAFPGPDGVLGTSDDIRPYNNFLQQQTILNQNGEPLWLAPNGEIVGSPSFTYNASTDALAVTIDVKNAGQASFQSPFYITAYQNNVGSSVSYTYKYENQILPGETAAITFEIAKFKEDWYPFNNIVIRINDIGDGQNHQAVCKENNITYTSSNIIATDDIAYVFIESTDNLLNVADNDFLPGGCTTPTIEVLSTPAYTGSATLDGSRIKYTPAAGERRDTLHYRIYCGDVTKADTAAVYINITDRPDNISDADCFGDPPGVNFSFKLLSSSSTTYPVNNYNMPVVGDIDNDGYTEIIVGATSASGYVSINKLHIFKFKDNKIEHQQTITTPYFNNVANPYAIAKVDDNDYAAIFLCTDYYVNSKLNSAATGDQLKLIKYVYNPTSKLYEEFKVGGNIKRGTYSAQTRKEMAQPMIVDFNGDGIPEVVAYDKVFNARTMELLVDGDYLKDALVNNGTAMGFGYGGHMNNNQGTVEGSSIMAVGDMDGDGIPEVIGGNCVYKVNITNPNGTGGNTFTLWSRCSQLGPNGEFHREAVDGTTAIADMDGDGLLDIIVTNGRYRSSSGGSLYIWNPRTGKVMHTNIVEGLPIPATNAMGPSVAFIGDIDNTDKKNQPEICFTGLNRSYAYQYNPVTKTLTKKWDIATGDSSGATTMVMFDFDQDGDNELVYRDTGNLRILNGKDGSDKIAPISCTSGTAIEYPVVADINKDGAAEIIVTGGTQLRVYASDPVGSWAPARKVWNQFAYNSVNINEDLSVPKVQFNPGATLTGGSCGDVRPYNGYLLQQTSLNKFGCPIFLLPNLNFDGEPSYSYYAKGDSLLINVKFKNDGDAAIGAPIHVSVYKDDVLAANFMATASKNIVVLPDQTGECTIKVENISSFEPYSKLVVRLNDNGSATPVQKECNEGHDSFKPQNQMLIAVNDTLRIHTNDINKLADVLDNDQLVGCTKDDVGFELVPSKPPVKGSASLDGRKISYTPNADYIGLDSLHYKITCGNDMSTAELFVVVKGLLRIDMVSNASEPGNKGKCKVGFIDANAKYDRPLKITYQITGGSAIHSTDYTDVLTGTITLPSLQNNMEFDIVIPKDNYIVEGNGRSVEITITSVEVE